MWASFRNTLLQYSDVDDEALALSQSLFYERKLARGTYFVKDGEICTQLAFVHKGLFRSFYANDRGEEITYCFALEGDMETSFESFISSRPSALSIIAMEDSEVLMIDKEPLYELFDRHLFWSKLGRLLTEAEYLKMTRHASESKTETAQVKYLNILEQRPALIQRVPLHYIASYLGISSRHMTRMRRTLAGK